MDEFDVNKELLVINIEDNAFTIHFENEIFEYFYHAHRLGTRVPLFVILSEENRWNEETIVYFCKIGNVLGLKGSGNLSMGLAKLLRRYGTNHGIMIYLGDDGTKVQMVVATIQSSVFLQSEIQCFVQVSETYILKKNASIKCLHVVKVKNVDLQNALILEKIQRELQIICLDWTWQYEQSDKLFLFSKLVFKNLEKWSRTDPVGKVVKGTRFIPMKLMRDEDEKHSPLHILSKYPNVGLIIDLSNDEGSYEKGIFLEKAVEYKRIQIGSKVIPSSTDVFEFIRITNEFLIRNTGKDIIVHCHYGYNRTGLMICAYLIEVSRISVQEALKRFKEARPPGIKHQNYIDKLILRYSDYEKRSKSV